MKILTWLEMEFQKAAERQRQHDLEMSRRDRDCDRNYYGHRNEEERRFEKEVQERVDEILKDYDKQFRALAKQLRESREELQQAIKVARKKL